MDKKIAEMWVAALRNGGYRQTKEVLKSKNGYCCLGVLCDLYNKGYPKIPVNAEEFDDGFPPLRVLTWAKTKNRFNYQSKHQSRNLTEDNDTAKHNFNKIADIIEAHVEEL